MTLDLKIKASKSEKYSQSDFYKTSVQQYLRAQLVCLPRANIAYPKHT